MVTQNPPRVQPGFKGSILKQLDRGGIRRFHNMQIVDQTLTGIQQPENKLIPDCRPDDVPGHGAICVVAPV